MTERNGHDLWRECPCRLELAFKADEEHELVNAHYDVLLLHPEVSKTFDDATNPVVAAAIRTAMYVCYIAGSVAENPSTPASGFGNDASADVDAD